MSKLSIIPRRSKDRGVANHEWLKTFHTWSFSTYNDPKFQEFGCLRVLNEDRVQPGTGFGSHSHREFEIFSYIVDGELQHKDSMGNTEIIHRGEIQFTSAGTGITHSEYNINKSLPVHFIQIWVKPDESQLKPSYSMKKWLDTDKENKLALLVDNIKDADANVIPIHAKLSMYASILSPSKSVTYAFKRSKGYLHLIMRSGYETPEKSAKLKIKDEVLNEGDGVFILCEPETEVTIESLGDVTAEFLLFDLE
ncbi:unnamed protein product [Didymodactylos carnosus]|uniref:Pirin n=1 Tax=Didymodactylos carnosus TaxID=1234261 RepID=A0A815J2Q7_9BILA|nr:unnamed protein product [Didymodactylos carnosus]CAF4264213.1 unnamed protein product [Didymodactylos carnosus]